MYSLVIERKEQGLCGTVGSYLVIGSGNALKSGDLDGGFWRTTKVIPNSKIFYLINYRLPRMLRGNITNI